MCLVLGKLSQMLDKGALLWFPDFLSILNMWKASNYEVSTLAYDPCELKKARKIFFFYPWLCMS